MRLARRRVADIARYAANSDRRTERPRERHAAESSEQRETRLARRRVADRASLSQVCCHQSLACETVVIIMQVLSYPVMPIYCMSNVILYILWYIVQLCFLETWRKYIYTWQWISFPYSWVRSRSPIMLSIQQYICIYIYIYIYIYMYRLYPRQPVYTGNIREVVSDNARGRSPRALSVNHRGYFPVYTATQGIINLQADEPIKFQVFTCVIALPQQIFFRTSLVIVVCKTQAASIIAASVQRSGLVVSSQPTVLLVQRFGSSLQLADYATSALPTTSSRHGHPVYRVGRRALGRRVVHSYGGTTAIWKRPIRHHQPSEARRFVSPRGKQSGGFAWLAVFEILYYVIV